VRIDRWTCRRPSIYCPSGKPGLAASTFKIAAASPSAFVYSMVTPLNTMVRACHWRGLKCSLHGHGCPHLKHFPLVQALLMSIGTPCPPNIPGWFGWTVVDEEGAGADGRGQALKGH